MPSVERATPAATSPADTGYTMIQPIDSHPRPLTGDFRRVLQCHLDAIALRDADLYAMTLAADDGPCLRQDGRDPIFGREAIVDAVRAWFADKSWRYIPTVLWTLEQPSTALALLEVNYIERDRAARVHEEKRMQLLVFQRRAGSWRLVFDHAIAH